MDKNAIKKYAVWARRELISRVSQRAALYEITDKGFGDASSDSVLGRVMSAEEKRQRQALIAQIREKGYEQVMEEIAYTWFNRFIALRFMEVNGYLPSRVRVFTDDENNFKPQILAEAINMELDGLDMKKVYALKNANDDDALFKYMIIVQCNALSSILPGLFQRISDYTELLFPDNLLREGSVIEQMVSMIPEEDWTDQVQIIGWLYQYYNTEPKDKVFADLKKNIKISKENIPAATQLFTPDWIVRYMVENSLGRLWLEGHPNDELKATWKYYLDEAEQEPDVQAQLAEIRKEYAALKPEDIRAIDPCQGSGHILAYMFDVLVQIYESYGYTAREAASSIVQHNIWGLDIDDRAAQLAYFSVMMKARQYDRRFFSRGIQPHVYAIRESNNLDPHCIEFFADGRNNLKLAIDTLVGELHDAKEYGSILNVTKVDFEALYARFEEIQNDATPGLYSYSAIEGLLPLVQVAEVLAKKYHVTVTNPPYMTGGGMSVKLSNYVKKNYPEAKADLFAVFIDKCRTMTCRNGFHSMITQHAWMFLSSFEKLRIQLQGVDVVNMAHLGARAFEDIGGEVVQTTSFVFRRSKTTEYIATYCRLVNAGSQSAKEALFLSGENRFEIKASRFNALPGNIVGYHLSSTVFEIFEHSKNLADVGTARQGLGTSDNNRFLRMWYEVEWSRIGFGLKSTEETKETLTKWFPYIKGGAFRRWYPIHDYVVNYANDGFDIKASVMKKYPYLRTPDFVVKNTSTYFHSGITWSDVATGLFSARWVDDGSIYADAGPMYFPAKNEKLFLGYFNTPVFQMFGDLICQGMHYSTGHIPKIPYILPHDDDGLIASLVDRNMMISKQDCDCFETSWDFEAHPLVQICKKLKNPDRISAEEKEFYADLHEAESTIETCFNIWQRECQSRFYTMKSNEETINRFFIDVYELQDEIKPEVNDENVSVYTADLGQDIRSLLSYAVGCMFGRYSLGTSGLIYAGGNWDESNYSTYIPDKDAIIPICDDEYYEDDIVGRLISFITIVFGKETLEDNLRFIASALGGKGSPREVIRNYFINDFYADHLKTYQKRPIYWLFDSGKKNGFKCLIYMHRYQPDMIARIRTDYVHEQQSRYRTAIADLENRTANAETGERVKLSKQLTKLQTQAEELRVYEEKIHHLADQKIRIDLDDGVKHNYAIFQDVLAKIK